MDFVGGTTPLATHIDVVFRTFKLIRSLNQNYHNAPVEIQDLRHRLEALNNNLLLLRRVQTSVSDYSNALDLDSTEFDSLKSSLSATRIIFTEILSFLEQKTSKNDRSARVQWALRDAKRAKAWELRLQRHSEPLQMTLILLNSRYLSLYESELKVVKEALRLQTLQLNRLVSKSTPRFSWAGSVFGSDWVLPHVAKLNGSICCLEDSKQQLYGISLRLHALFCLKVFTMELSFKRGSLFSLALSPIGTRVVLKNLVPEDSPIMVACQIGEMSAVMNLLNEGKASVNDITPDNFSPLSYAIAGGSLDVLSILVNKGADIRKSFGRFQTGPLDWALAHRQYVVARWLLRNGADVHHISARGWTPAFSLFGEESYHQNSCEEFLELLLGASFDNFNAQDGAGWTILHRAAAWGNADHVKSLLARGATLDTRMSNLGWTPIFCAVQFNNLSTFAEIVQNQPDFLAATDARGWTLLHVAVNASRLEMIQLLIELGADPHALSIPTASYIPEGMRNLSLTPGDIANIRGSTVLAAYLGALAASGHKVHAVANEKGDALDLFWPSISYIILAIESLEIYIAQPPSRV